MACAWHVHDTCLPCGDDLRPREEDGHDRVGGELLPHEDWEDLARRHPLLRELLRQLRPQLLRRKQGGTGFGQLALRRLLSAPDHAPGCPKLRPASANQPNGLRWPATQALVFTQRRACTMRVWACTRKAVTPFASAQPSESAKALPRGSVAIASVAAGRCFCACAKARLARAPEAVAGRPVAQPLTRSAETARAARRALRRCSRQAGALPRWQFL
eukprot:scaffold5453_cov58-Phaeocystis_antarctica.AAC.6